MSPQKRKKNRKPKNRGSSKRRGWTFKKAVFAVLALGIVALALYVGYLDQVIRNKFEGKRWDLPAVVYARPLELYAGLPFSAGQLEEELQLAGYRKDATAVYPGSYDRGGNLMHLVTRTFHFPEGPEQSARLTVYFSGNGIEALSRTDTGERLALARLDPARIGSFHPRQHEDRIVLTRKELPELLIKTLLAVEDRNFYTHVGLDPRAIARAVVANIRAGGTVQGGSTLTQQLVKNFFLNNRRTLQRKFNEAIMALLLELHYSKDEILTAYTNEVFLGQDGSRAVHGFGLASLFYFRRDLEHLSPAQIALLVGMVKGPSYYDPRRYPDRSLKRRGVVLDILRERGIIGQQTYQQASNAPIGSSDKEMSGFNRFPAFLDLVRRQLGRDYREEDLTTDGLKILTTLDPQVQWQVERQLADTIAALERRTGAKKLEGAAIVSSREGGEILAVAGGRRPLATGFNRAADASRPIGSLIKPAVYLTALNNGYTLTTPLDDTSLTLPDEGGKKWTPRNFDRIEHGQVPFYEALVQSYNLATIKLGMDVGVENVMRTVKALGVDRGYAAYPSFLLGAAPMAPLEVAQMYQTLAAGGFYLPQRVISSVLAADNTVLKRFGLSVEQRFTPESVYLLNTTLQRVVREGTGKTLSRYLPDALTVAGKTGTSDDLRDSWFAGFTGDKLAVVWLGRDDNKPIGLTGAGGAMVAWGKIMRTLHPQALELAQPAGVEWAWVDPATRRPASRFQRNAEHLPFIIGSAPSGTTRPAANAPAEEREQPGFNIFRKILDWFN